jgi:hypothetical protein
MRHNTTIQLMRSYAHVELATITNTLGKYRNDEAGTKESAHKIPIQQFLYTSSNASNLLSIEALYFV